jgi:hypothetical protein
MTSKWNPDKLCITRIAYQPLTWLNEEAHIFGADSPVLFRWQFSVGQGALCPTSVCETQTNIFVCQVACCGLHYNRI